MSKPAIGIIMLNTRFPRVRGDIGNPQTWSFPVCYEVVKNATPARVVTDGPRDESLVEPFLEAAQRLVERGARGITTSCGFLSLYQDSLERHAGVPVVASSLLQIAPLESKLPADRRIGVITFDSRRLGPRHLAAAGARTEVAVVGVEKGWELYRVISGDRPKLDRDAARADVISAGEALLADYPDVGAVVLECTNMSPYARDLSHHLMLPVYDIVGLVNRFQANLDCWETACADIVYPRPDSDYY